MKKISYEDLPEDVKERFDEREYRIILKTYNEIGLKRPSEREMNVVLDKLVKLTEFFFDGRVYYQSKKSII